MGGGVLNSLSSVSLRLVQDPRLPSLAHFSIRSNNFKDLCRRLRVISSSLSPPPPLPSNTVPRGKKSKVREVSFRFSWVRGEGGGVRTKPWPREEGPGPRGGHKYWTGCLRSSCYGELPRGQFRGSSVNEPPRMPHASFCAPGPLASVWPTRCLTNGRAPGPSSPLLLTYTYSF